MTYDLRELSQDDGSPQHLYEFTLNDKAWRYTSGTPATSAAQGYVDMIGFQWLELAISHAAIRQTGDSSSETMLITMPSDRPIPLMFNTTPPSSPIKLVIREYHRGDSEAAIKAVVEITSCNQPAPGKAELSGIMLAATLARNGLRLHYSRNCPHVLYDTQCRAERIPVTATVTEAGNGLIRADEFAARPPGFFDGGYLEWDDPVRGLERRAIEQHTGNTVLMFGTSDGINGGMEVQAFPGCNKTFAACSIKFNNSENYGGFPALPSKSPFDGDPVY